MNGQAVLITGASSGIGLESAVYLAGRGFRVLAAMRNLAKAGPLQAAVAAAGKSVELIELDVTSAASVQAAAAETARLAPDLFAVVHNAGIQLRGYFEDQEDGEIRRVFETNVFGAMALTRALLPGMRVARRGRIILVSSIGGRMGSVGLSSYCASKFAIEGFGESLALELLPLGIHVSLVEPAIIRTAIWEENRNVAPAAQSSRSPYFLWFQESERMADWAVKTSPTLPVHVAEAIYTALTSARPRMRYLVGTRAGAVLTLRKLLPFELFDRVYRRFLLSRMLRLRGSESK